MFHPGHSRLSQGRAQKSGAFFSQIETRPGLQVNYELGALDWTEFTVLTVGIHDLPKLWQCLIGPLID